MFARMIGAIFANGLLASASFGGGWWIARILPASFSRFDRLACSCLGGLGILGIALFLIGQLTFRPESCLIVLVSGALIAAVVATRSGKTASHEVAGDLKIPRVPAILLGFVLLITFISGFADIVGDWGNDAIAYHFLGPKVWLREGVVRPVPDNSHTAFPAVAEMLYGSLMATGGRFAPGLSAVLTLLIFFLLVFSVAKRVTQDIPSAWWGVALVATMPAVYAGAHSGFVDVLYAGFVLAAARIGLDAEREREYAAFGLFCGLAMATKYTGLPALAALVLCTGISRIKFARNSWMRVCSLDCITIGVACLVASPFYLRNWILLGCPIYPPPPGLLGICHAKYMSPESIREFHQYIYRRGAGLGRGLWAYMLLPFNLTYHTSNFHGAGGIGLSALALAPFGLVACRWERFARGLAVLGVLLTTMWFLTQQESRFLIPVYVIGAIFAVSGWRYVLAAGQRFSRLLCLLVIGVSVLYGSYMIALARKDDLVSVISPRFAEQQREKWIPYRESFDFVNHDSSVHKLLILDRSVPPYYCDKSYLKPVGQWGEEVVPGGGNPGLILGEVHKLGITHVLDVESQVSGFQVPVGAKGLSLAFERPKQRVYRVN